MDQSDRIDDWLLIDGQDLLTAAIVLCVPILVQSVGEKFEFPMVDF